jgi:hypothetical protein
MINFNDDGVWEQQQDDMIEYFGNKDDDSDFEIVIDDENIIPDFEALMPTTCQEIEEFDLEELTSRMIEKHECELALLEEFENNCEKF